MAELNLKDGLKAMDVAEYLRQHPQFLKDFPDLATQLVIPREQGPAASLASYQLETLRRRNSELEQRLAELIEIAGENEQLMVQVHSLTTALLRTDSLAGTVQCVVDRLTEDFGTDLVRVMLFREAEQLPDAAWLIAVPDGAAALPEFGEFLARQEPLVGRLAADKLSRLFGEQASAVQSAALMRLGGAGMLAIGSLEPNRFHPGMGTVFLKLIAESVGAALARYPAED
ncbi:DUF484 family protein [Oleiagrimonas sp. C23AA]|uniref:DUF484 family protein n=1 Tax=Oleiagrimonas sp. C23AA TaxID=2719047 RepID=UPI00142028D5|nr:DUF484 family protein [Oleiagrimonas sp. C23AA]NII10711.1 DUF484 family protein [Oleiagrimonas sp. C23AA]